jgi:hypothetical protein
MKLPLTSREFYPTDCAPRCWLTLIPPDVSQSWFDQPQISIKFWICSQVVLWYCSRYGISQSPANSIRYKPGDRSVHLQLTTKGSQLKYLCTFVSHWLESPAAHNGKNVCYRKYNVRAPSLWRVSGYRRIGPPYLLAVCVFSFKLAARILRNSGLS